jgi:hypothetical protein
MPTIQGVTAVLTGATNINVLTGSVYEYLPFNAQVEFAVVGDAAGEMRATVISGSDTILEESPISRQARVPVYPDDYSLVDMVGAGERLTVRARNTGAGTNSLFWSVKITPFG